MQTEIRIEALEADRSQTHFAPAATPTPVGEKVRRYFETSGFSRWTAIYGTGDIPPIWKIIRDGHQRALDTVIKWVKNDNTRTALDAGCGTGTLSIELANTGYEVDAFDVSAPMVHFAKYINSGRTKRTPPSFHVGDITVIEGQQRSYDLVCCLDVLFHYPFEEASEMLTRLANLSSHKVVASFALRTPMNDFWMEIGKKFHSKNRMTHLYMFTLTEVAAVMQQAGFVVTNFKRVKFFFYDSFVFEAVRAS